MKKLLTFVGDFIFGDPNKVKKEKDFIIGEPKIKSSAFQNKLEDKTSNKQTSNGKMNNININGNNFSVSGNNIVVENDIVMVNGKIIASGLSGIVKIEFTGDLAKLDCNTCTITGNVLGTVEANTITCGDVGGDIEANTVNCKDVTGSIDANTVKCKTSKGTIKT